jgi:RimJ/RimL family protein N-acetyltransferase
MKTTAKIRPATERDLEGIASLYYQFWNEHSDFEKMKTVLLNIQSNKNYALFVAEMDSIIIGTIFGIVCDELYGECKPFLVMEDLVVDPKYRRLGIAKQLVNEIELFGTKMKCTQIQFITERNREGTVQFYESIGFDSKINIGFKRKLEPIKFENLCIERYSEIHMAAIQEIASDERTTSNTNTPWPYPSNGAEQYLKICNENWECSKSRDFVVTLNNRVIGNCAIVNLDSNEPMIGYMISEQYWGLGIGKLLVSKLLDYCKNDLMLFEIYAPVLIENIPSQKVLISNGFTEIETFELPNNDPKFPNRKMIKYKKVV